jgi:5'-methylthioadenosine nucleosidase
LLSFVQAAAVAWACSLSGTPFFALKSVTDLVDGDKPSGEEFMENLHKAAAHLKEAVVGAVSFLEGKKLGDL